MRGSEGENNGAAKRKRSPFVPRRSVDRRVDEVRGARQRRGSPPGEDFRYPDRLGWSRHGDSNARTEHFRKRLVRARPGQEEVAEEENSTSLCRESSSVQGRGNRRGRTRAERGGVGEVYRTDKSAISAPRFINACACTRFSSPLFPFSLALFSSPSFLSLSFSVSCSLSCPLSTRPRHADKRRIRSFPRGRAYRHQCKTDDAPGRLRGHSSESIEIPNSVSSFL